MIRPELEVSLDLRGTALPVLPPDENGEQADAAPETAVTEEGWTFEVAPFVWALALDGDVTAKGRGPRAEASPENHWQTRHGVVVRDASSSAAGNPDIVAQP